MVKSRSDFDALINLATAIEDAKKQKYNGKDLDATEKLIFDNALLKGKDASGNEIIKLDEVKDTAALLFNFKEASDKLEEAEKRGDNLTTDEVGLLDALMDRRRNGTVDYRVIIEGEPNNEEKIDKVIRSYQLINLREDNRKLSSQKTKLQKEIGTLTGKRKKLDDKINELKPKYTYQRREELKDYITRTNEAITRLKNGLEAGQTGLLILNKVIEEQEKSANVLFKTSNPYLDSVPSVIETAIKSPYSTNKYTHPSYLTEELSWQMMELFRQFDKTKLFALIDNKFNAADAKEIKGAYKRVVEAKVKNIEDFVGKEQYIQEVVPLGTKLTGKGLTAYPEKLEDVNKTLVLSDIFYFMNAFFPQNTTNFDFSNSDFLKDGSDSALPFTGTNDLTTKHRMLYRGRPDNLAGIKYKESGVLPNPYTIDPHYPPEHLQLSWATDGGKSIPQFFWQAFNSPEATQWIVRKILSKDGVNLIPTRTEKYSVFEDKLRYVGLPSLYNRYSLAVSFFDWVKGVLENGDKSANIDVEKYWDDWKITTHTIFSEVANNSFNAFREEAREITFEEMERSSELMIYNAIASKEKTVNTRIKGLWDEMKIVAQSKLNDFDKKSAELGEKEVERNEVTAQINQKRIELAENKRLREGLKTGKVGNLKKQLKYLGEKITNTTVLNIITRQEAAAIKNLYWLLKKLEDRDTLGVDTDGKDLDSYVAKIKILEEGQEGLLKTYYATWKGLGKNFTERLNNWRKTEGLYLEEDSVRYHLEQVKKCLNDAKGQISLTPEEDAELLAITNYLKKNRELTDGDIRLAFSIYKDISNKLVNEWKNYGDKKYFAEDNTKLVEIGSFVNDLEDKEPFFTDLRTYVNGKSGVPVPPNDTVSEYEMLDYYFSLSPEHIIVVYSAYKVKTEDAEKAATKTEMEKAKDGDKVLDKSKYGDGKNFTDEGIIKYYSERFGGVNHSYSKQQDKGPGKDKPESFWSWDNPIAIVSGICLGISAGIIIAGIVYWDKIAAWWDGPADAEGNGGDEEDDNG